LIEIKKIHFIGLSNVLKPKIVLENLQEMKSLKDKKVEYITDKDEGMVVDFCKKNDINIILVDHENLDSNINELKEKNADLLICLGWNRRITRNVLDIYKKAINCHGGLLPDYRGNRVYMSVYANIPEEYGATIHYMTENYDDGNIIKQAKIKLFLEETPLVIHRRICELTALILPESIRLVEEEYTGEIQKGKARFFKPLSRKMMDTIRNENIERIRLGQKKIITPHKEWDL